ncbi:unnamed protein product [Angiostrongylus costaricensis]|uniref:SHSP domain-containing protein n=1 Tax=Angiostrongylus costaricensis TaxID=334426 RepID=A0A0R3PD49_ANGCS|nr:unnamed protein product [Angiostrongylus costaricensis]
MDLWPRSMNRMMDNYFRDFDRFERSLFPYWRNADHSVLHVANEAQQVAVFHISNLNILKISYISRINYLHDRSNQFFLHRAERTFQMVNDDSKFAVSLDVSQFRPEELKVHLEGNELTIEGKHQHKNDTSFMERSFVRKWMLPENVDLEALRTQLNDAGHLPVEAPKVGHPGAQKRSISIERIPYQLLKIFHYETVFVYWMKLCY